MKGRHTLCCDKQHSRKTRILSPRRSWLHSLTPGEASRSHCCHCLVASEKWPFINDASTERMCVITRSSVRASCCTRSPCKPAGSQASQKHSQRGRVRSPLLTDVKSKKLWKPCFFPTPFGGKTWPEPIMRLLMICIYSSWCISLRSNMTALDYQVLPRPRWWCYTAYTACAVDPA